MVQYIVAWKTPRRVSERQPQAAFPANAFALRPPYWGTTVGDISFALESNDGLPQMVMSVSHPCELRNDTAKQGTWLVNAKHTSNGSTYLILTQSATPHLAEHYPCSLRAQNLLIISLEVGRSLGCLAQHSRMMSARSGGAFTGTVGRSPLNTTRLYMSKGRASSAHGTSVESTSQATTPKLYTSLA